MILDWPGITGELFLPIWGNILQIEKGAGDVRGDLVVFKLLYKVYRLFE